MAQKGSYYLNIVGAYVPDEVSERISLLVSSLNIPVGFHAHNNLGLAIANSIAAAQAGGRSSMVLHGGLVPVPGNAQIEAVVAVLEKLGYSTGIDLYKILDASEIAETD